LRALLFFLSFFLFLPGAPAQQGAQDTATCMYVQSIHIDGRRKTRDVVILRELSVQPGDCLPESSLDQVAELNRQRLYNLRLFNEVDVRWNVLCGDTVQMQISVIDRFPIFPEFNVEFADRNFNVWWSEQHRDLRRINLGLTLNHNNFRGNREVIGVTGQAGYTQEVGLSYSRPFVDKQQKHGFGLSVFGLQNREIAYKTNWNKLLFYRDENNFVQRRFDVSGWYTYRPRYAIVHTLQLTFQHYWINSRIAALNPDYLGEGHNEENVLSFRYRFEWNRTDNWNYPLAGKRFIGYFDQKYLFSDRSFQSSFHVQYDQYLNPWKNWYAAFIFRGRLSFPQRQPYIFQQNLGYDFDYIRGFEYYVLDGSAFSLLRIDFKRTLLDKTIRLPVRYFEVIPIQVYAKIYGDAGISYNKFPVNDLLNNRGLLSGGAGIDIVTLYDIKVRIEYTFNSLREKGLFLHKNGE